MMTSNRFQTNIDAINTYARYELHGTLDGVTLQALAIDEERRDLIIQKWQALRVRDVTCAERTAPELPSWNVYFQTNGRYNQHTMVLQASSPAVIESRLRTIHKRIFCFKCSAVESLVA